MCWAPVERAAASWIGDSNFRWPAWRRRQIADFIAARHSKGMLHLEMGIHLLRYGHTLAVVSQLPETVCRYLQGCRRHVFDGLGELRLSIGANDGVLNKGIRICVRPDLADKSFQLRTWQPGDCLNILRRGHRKISDLLNELHADPIARMSALVLCDDDGPFWLVGHWSDQRVAPTSEDKLVLEVEWKTT
jgi:tRNA(Ile)-lysidine synthetase-like protein